MTLDDVSFLKYLIQCLSKSSLGISLFWGEPETYFSGE